MLTDPPSTIFVRVFLDGGWEDPKLSIENPNVLGIYNSQTATQFAASKRNSDAIKWLASKSVDLNRDVLNGTTAVYALLHHNRLSEVFWPEEVEAEVCRTLLQCGVKPRVPDGSGPYASYRPGVYFAREGTFIVSDLQVAIHESCSTEIVALLLENGAEEVESMDEWYMMALWECFRRVDHRNHYEDVLNHLSFRVSEHDRSLRDYLLDKAGDYILARSKLGNVFSPPSRYISNVTWKSTKPYARRVFLEELAKQIGRDYDEITNYQLLDKPLTYESVDPLISSCLVEDADEILWL